MSSQNPHRLRTDGGLPRSLRSALRELPNEEPTSEQLAALRGRLGLRAAAHDTALQTPLVTPVAQSQRMKSRRIGRTVAAFVLFPIAAAAAVGTAVETARRALSPVAVASSAVLASKPAPRALPAAPVPPSASALTAPELAPVGPEPERRVPLAVPSARATSSALRFSPVLEPDTRPSNKPSEVNLLQRANAALKTDPAAALALAEQHRRTYPNANLSQEGDVITIKAWLALGNVERARTALASFERAYPHSAYTAELRQAVR